MGDTVVPEPERRAAPRAVRSRWARRVVVGVAVLLLAVLGIDRGAHYFVNRELQQNVAAANDGMQAQASGFPFLTQALTGGFHVDVTAPSLPLEGEDIRLNDLRATLSDVTGTSLADARAGGVDARAVVPWADIERRANLPAGSLGPADGGRVRITQRVEVFGAQVDAAAYGRLSVEDNAVVVDPESFELQGSPLPLEGQLRERAGAQLRQRVPLNGLPAGTRLAGVEVAPEGLRVHVVGNDVPLQPLVS